MRPIDADALLKKLQHKRYATVHTTVATMFQREQNFMECMSVVVDAPTIDAEPVRHGRWILNKHYGDYECSVCGKSDITEPLFKQCRMYYCPNCGAKMDAEVKK